MLFLVNYLKEFQVFFQDLNFPLGEVQLAYTDLHEESLKDFRFVHN